MFFFQNWCRRTSDRLGARSAVMRSADQRAISRSDTFPPTSIEKIEYSSLIPKKIVDKTNTPNFSNAYIQQTSIETIVPNDNISNKADDRFYGDLSQRNDKFGYSETQTTVICLNSTDKENLEKSYARKLSHGFSRKSFDECDDEGSLRKRCSSKTPWCHLGRLALVALCVAAVCAIAPSAQARHAQQADTIKVAENETALNNSAKIRLENNLK